MLPNGIDLDVLDDLAGPTPRTDVRTLLEQVAARFLGEDVSDAAFVATSGRYEFHNKGIDLVLESLVRLEGVPGRHRADQPRHETDHVDVQEQQRGADAMLLWKPPGMLTAT